VKAVTLSVSTLVTIEMLLALLSVSENERLLDAPPGSTPVLLLAVGASFGLHLGVLYVPGLASIFQVVPLTWQEWGIVSRLLPSWLLWTKASSSSGGGC